LSLTFFGSEEGIGVGTLDEEHVLSLEKFNFPGVFT
jgi:hypothetical protein